MPLDFEYASFKFALPAAAALCLAACAPETPTDYETDVVDESGGDLIVEDADAPGVDVELPETPMKTVPAEEAEADGASGE